MSSVPCPPDFLCPINQTLMVDPVVAQDGNSYERSAILEWYVNHNTSPITREVVRKDLIPNIRLRSLIQEYAEANNIPLPKIIAPTHASKPFTKEDPPTITSTILKTLGATYVEMTFQAPPSVENPQHVIAVIDTSGSMNEETQRPVSGQESLGFTRLDFVKHSLRTILAALRPTDALTLIEFNSGARTHVPFALMTAENKSRVGELLTRLYPGGGTNIYQGLKQAIEPLRESKYASYNNTILLFTDGEPTPDFTPQGGIVKATETLLKTVELPLTINTYGFGYALDTNLLHDLANLRSGSFHYIPDLTMIGTVFVNSIANLLQATMNNVNIVYDCKILNYIGSQSHIDVPNTTGPREVTLQVNTLSHAPQTHLWEITDKELLATEGVTIPFRITYGNYSIQHDVPLIVPATLAAATPEVAMPILLPHRYTELLDYMSKLDDEVSLASFQANLGFFRQSILGISHPILNAILSEITADPQNPNVGQVSLAVQDKETYKRWGQNHIVSLLSAHRKRICHNFKDPSVQIYATPEFQAAMTAISNLYADIPSPQPSRNNRIAAGTINMASLSLNASDGCFGPDSMVYMADGTKKPAYAIKAGDMVRSMTSPIHGSKILCVVKTATNHRRTIMVKMNEELSLTPYHPVVPKTFGMGDNIQQKWEFPVNLANQDIQDIPYVYNFVLQDDHRGIVVGGYMCATLGHNYYNEPVIGHPYFAHQVVVDLKAMPGFKEGLVTFERLVALRDPVSGMICKWIMG